MLNLDGVVANLQPLVFRILLTYMQFINVTLARNLFCSLYLVFFLLSVGTPSLTLKSVSFRVLKSFS